MRSGQRRSNCGHTPINLFVDDVPMLIPLIHAFPDDCGYMPVSTEIIVVLPAPFGPSSPKIYFYYMYSVKGFRAI